MAAYPVRSIIVYSRISRLMMEHVVSRPSTAVRTSADLPDVAAYLVLSR